jgi:hydroxymethylbilane synthase
MKKNIRVVTRGSLLAVTQTNQVVERLQQLNPECTFEIITVKTTGDKVTDRPLSSFRGTGVFVKELQNTLLNKKAELAVHSLKDIPIEQPDEILLAAFPERVDVRDVLLSRNKETFEELQEGAMIGTSSPRRFVQLKSARKDLRFSDLRGNLDTRLKKLEDGLYDAIIMAAAGLKRLGMSFPGNAPLPFTICLPAVGQGALALECRKDDPETIHIVQSVNHTNTMQEITAERNFLSSLGGGCSMPIAAYAKITESSLRITGMVGDPETGKIVRDSFSTGADKYESAGQELGRRMLELCKKENIKIT